MNQQNVYSSSDIKNPRDILLKNSSDFNAFILIINSHLDVDEKKIISNEKIIDETINSKYGFNGNNLLGKNKANFITKIIGIIRMVSIENYFSQGDKSSFFYEPSENYFLEQNRAMFFCNLSFYICGSLLLLEDNKINQETLEMCKYMNTFNGALFNLLSTVFTGEENNCRKNINFYCLWDKSTKKEKKKILRKINNERRKDPLLCKMINDKYYDCNITATQNNFSRIIKSYFFNICSRELNNIVENNYSKYNCDVKFIFKS